MAKFNVFQIPKSNRDLANSATFYGLSDSFTQQNARKAFLEGEYLRVADVEADAFGEVSNLVNNNRTSTKINIIGQLRNITVGDILYNTESLLHYIVSPEGFDRIKIVGARQQVTQTIVYYVYGTSSFGGVVGKRGYYYPLYLNLIDAQAADANGQAHLHKFTEYGATKFYMPNDQMNHGLDTVPSSDLGYVQYGGTTTASTASTTTSTTTTSSSSSSSSSGSGY